MPVFLPGEFHAQRILVDYSPGGRKESDTTGQLTLTYLFYIWTSIKSFAYHINAIFCLLCNLAGHLIE